MHLTCDCLQGFKVNADITEQAYVQEFRLYEGITLPKHTQIANFLVLSILGNFIAMQEDR